MMRSQAVRTIGTLLLACLLLACGARPAPIAVSRDAVVLAFGDSLTAGQGAKAGESYPEQLAALTGLTIINSGVNGETTAEGLQRLPRVLDEVEPALVLLCLGGNDMLRKRSEARMRANLSRMIDLIRGRGADVVLIGVPQPVLIGLDDHPAYAELAEESAVPLIAEVFSEVLSKSGMKSDRIHPNAAGYRQVAERIRDRLEIR